MVLTDLAGLYAGIVEADASKDAAKANAKAAQANAKAQKAIAKQQAVTSAGTSQALIISGAALAVGLVAFAMLRRR